MSPARRSEHGRCCSVVGHACTVTKRGERARPGDEGTRRSAAVASTGASSNRDPGSIVRGSHGRDSPDVVERLAVTLVRPLRALVAQRGVEADRVQRALDVVGVVTLLEQRERDPPGPATRLGERRLGELRLRPLRVRDLQLAREATEMTGVDRRDVATHRDGVGHRVLAGEVELREPPQRAHDRRRAAVALAEPERVRRVDDGELDAVGVRSKRSAR